MLGLLSQGDMNVNGHFSVVVVLMKACWSQGHLYLLVFSSEMVYKTGFPLWQEVVHIFNPAYARTELEDSGAHPSSLWFSHGGEYVSDGLLAFLYSQRLELTHTQKGIAGQQFEHAMGVFWCHEQG